jgi:hypothetical protein
MILAEKNGIVAEFSEMTWQLLKDKRGWIPIQKVRDITKEIPPEIDAFMQSKVIDVPIDVQNEKVTKISKTQRQDLIAEAVANGIPIDKRWSNEKIQEAINDFGK